jgi:hypothetical protein
MWSPFSTRLRAAGAEALGYLLEHRMAAVCGRFDALTRAAGVGAALDLEVIT